MYADDVQIRVPDGIMRGNTDGYCYVFNPRGHGGVVVLFGEALKLFELCQRPVMIGTLSAQARLDAAKLEVIVASLCKLEILIAANHATSLRPSRKRRQMMVWLQLTDCCNLSCPYCYIPKSPTHMSLEMAKGLVAKVTQDCARRGFDEIVFKLAGGEPTLRWNDARALIDWAEGTLQGSAIRVRFHIITNATLVPETMLGYVAEKKLGISVSLDGVGYWHDQHRYYKRGRGSFADVDANIDKLLMHGVRPYILTTVTSANMSGLTELAEYCISRDLNFRFSLYRETNATADDLNHDTARLTEELLRCYGWIGLHLPARSLYECHRFGDIDLKLPKLRNCGIGVNGITLTSDGQLCLCQYEMVTPCGNALQSDAMELLKNQTHFPLDQNTVEQIPVCQDCLWRYTCGGGCSYLTKRHYGTFQHASPYCEVYQAVIPELIKLHAKQMIQNHERGIQERTSDSNDSENGRTGNHC